MGDDEIWMFDCLGLGNESRLLIVRVDEERGEARRGYVLLDLSVELGGDGRDVDLRHPCLGKRRRTR